MKLPAFQFYPGDWRKDPGVQSLTYHDRGIWFEILCLMHESEQRGKLILNGAPMPEDALARLLGLDKQILTRALTTLLNFGVASKDGDTGALVSRRMVRDEEIRNIRKKAGKMGGNPCLVNQNPTTQVKQKSTTGVNQKSTPSSSSSSSSSDIDPSAAALMVRIGGWLKRRPETQWSAKELKAFREVLKFKTPEEDLNILEAYYKSGAPYIRKDVLTLLNNWNGEIDRARDAMSPAGQTRGVPTTASFFDQI